MGPDVLNIIFPIDCFSSSANRFTLTVTIMADVNHVPNIVVIVGLDDSGYLVAMIVSADGSDKAVIAIPGAIFGATGTIVTTNVAVVGADVPEIVAIVVVFSYRGVLSMLLSPSP